MVSSHSGGPRVNARMCKRCPLGRWCGVQQLPDRNGRTYMMPGRVILGMTASHFIPCRLLCQNRGVPASYRRARLFARRCLQFGDAFRTDLMDDATQFLDASAEPIKFLFADLVMLGLCRAAHYAEWARERSEEHTSELQSLMRISYAVFCLKTKTH